MIIMDTKNIKSDQDNESVGERNVVKGQTVNIYQDPITEKDLEGKAELIELISVDMPYWINEETREMEFDENKPAIQVHQEWWTVHMEGDDPDYFVQRFIQVSGK